MLKHLCCLKFCGTTHQQPIMSCLCLLPLPLTVIGFPRTQVLWQGTSLYQPLHPTTLMPFTVIASDMI